MIKIIINKQWCFISGLEEDEYREIDAHLSYQVQGYFFSPLYRRGRWDGKAHLFNMKKSCFRLGFLGRVITFLNSNKLKYKLVDERKLETNYDLKYLKSLETKPVYEDIKFRDVQFDGVNKYLEPRFNVHLGRGILSMPPRAGKTTTAGVLLKTLNKYPILFIVHKIDLALQTKDEFEKIYKYKIGIVGDGNCDIDSKIVVSTIQSIRSVYNIKDKDKEYDNNEKALNEKDYGKVKEFISNCKVVVIDECHLSSAVTYQELTLVLEDVEQIIGLSGTPYRDDNTDLLIEQLCGPTVYELTKLEAKEKGYILPVISYFVHLPPVKAKGDYQTQKKIVLNENEYVLESIEKLVKRLEKKNLSSVIIVKEKQQGNLIQKRLKCNYLHGGIKGEDRKKVYSLLNQKKILTIVSTVTDVGVNIPTLDTVIIAHPTKSKVASFQRIRCNTAIPGKVYGRVFVICPELIKEDKDDKDYIKNHWRKMKGYYNDEPIITIKDIDYNEL